MRDYRGHLKIIWTHPICSNFIFMIYLLTAIGFHLVAVVQYTFTQYTERHKTNNA